MKKIFTLVIAIVSCYILNAQDFNRGDFLIGGSVGFNSGSTERSNEEKTKNTGFNVFPSIGKFYRDHRMAGVKIGYGHAKSELSKYEQDSYNFGVFLRQYLPLGKSFYLFAEEGASYWRLKTVQEQQFQNYRSDKKQNSFNVGLYPGIAYMLNKRLIAEIALDNLVNLTYSSEKTIDTYTDGTPTVHTDGRSVGLHTGFQQIGISNLGFGLKWLLQR